MGKNLYAGAHPEALKQIKGLVEEVNAGNRVSKEILLERLGTVDGVFAFASLTNAQLQKNYAELPPIWTKFAERTTVSDFRAINWLNFGLDFSNFKAADKGVARPGNVLPKVAEGEKYQAFSLTSSTLGFAVEKFGAQIGFTWESFVNDPFNTVKRIPQILSRTAVDVQDANATKALYTAANAAPHVAAVAAGGGLPATPINAPLTYEALAAARAQLKARKDAQGNPVITGKLVLNVSPALVPIAEAILAQQVLVQRIATSGTNYTETTSVSSLGSIEIVENRYLSFYSGSDLTWILSPAAGDNGGSDPAILQAFLAGEEEPEVRVNGLAGYSTSGLALPFTSGSFDTDTFDLRVRVVGGAGAVNSNPLILSTGAGV